MHTIYASWQCAMRSVLLIYHGLFEPASSSNQGLLTIARTQWDMPHDILIVSSTRGIPFKVVVCFNDYNYTYVLSVYMKKLGDFYIDSIAW